MFTEKHSVRSLPLCVSESVCGVLVHRQQNRSDLYYLCGCPSNLHEHMEVHKFMFTCTKEACWAFGSFGHKCDDLKQSQIDHVHFINML